MNLGRYWIASAIALLLFWAFIAWLAVLASGGNY